MGVKVCAELPVKAKVPVEAVRVPRLEKFCVAPVRLSWEDPKSRPPPEAVKVPTVWERPAPRLKVPAVMAKVGAEKL